MTPFQKYLYSPALSAPREAHHSERDYPLCAERVPRWQNVFEVAVALVVLLLTAPLMLVIAIIVRWGTPGPALFFQTRLGLNGKPFRFVKFRTMYHDARERFPELYAYKYDAGDLQTLKFKLDDDPRVTPQGRWLRRTTLDELPNFWNVLLRNMALVGPRPEIPEMAPYYKGELRRKFHVRPGITGTAQTSGRGRLTFHETVAYDIEYVRQKSFALDLKILLKTVWLVFRQDGAF